MNETFYLKTIWHDAWYEVDKEMYYKVESALYPKVATSSHGFTSGLIEGKIEYLAETPEYIKSLSSMWRIDFSQGFLALLSNINLSCKQSGGELHSRQTIALAWEIYNWLTKGCIVDMMTGMKHDELNDES